ncbi:MAG TPA: hypothetical protein VF591_22560 [Pyrinomonadaceae bacterium]|jgi:hypothetical protein
MASTEGDRRGELYLRADLSEEEHDRLVEELRADPGLLRDLLRETSREEEAEATSPPFGGTDVGDRKASDDTLRRYLLCDETLAPEDAARLEESLAEDERYFDQMQFVEAELIEDYLRGALAGEDVRRFRANFLVTPERREKLRNLRALAAAASAARPEKSARPARSSVWDSLRAFLRPPNLLRVAVAAAVCLLLISVVLLWLARRESEPGPLLAEDPTRGGPQNVNATPSPSPTAELASPTPLSPRHDEQPQKPGGGVHPTPERPTRPAAPPTVFALAPGVLRGGSAVAEKRIEPGSTAVELRLRLDIERAYDDYNLVIRDSGGREVARRTRLKPATRSGLPTVTVALPSSLFRPGDYTAALSGGSRGRYEEVGSYSFRITE